jgi:hypothetical protein
MLMEESIEQVEVAALPHAATTSESALAGVTEPVASVVPLAVVAPFCLSNVPEVPEKPATAIAWYGLPETCVEVKV